MLIRPEGRALVHALESGRVAIRAPVLALAVAVAAFWSTACSSDAPTSVEGVDIRAAKGGGGGKPGGGGGGSGDPIVKSADPASAPRDITLDVRVLGSGFDDGSVARFLLNGVALPDVATNSTRFASSKELVANITIAADATTDFYDVEVTTTRGKRGVGIELFEVTVTPIELAGLSRRGESVARGINDAGVIVGSSEDRSGTPRAVRWLPDGAGGWGEPEDLAPGPSAAFAVNETGLVVGIIWNKGGGPSSVVVWLPDGTQQELGSGSNGEFVDINGNNTVVGVLSSSKDWLAYRHDPSLGSWRAEVIAGSNTPVNSINGVSDGEVAFGVIPNGIEELAVSWTYASGQWTGPQVLSHVGAVGGWAMDATDAGVAGGLWVQPDPCGAGRIQAAAFWASRSADPIVIPGLDGRRSWSNDINSHGVVAGERWSSCNGSARGFVWSLTAGLRLLAPLVGGSASEALALNDAGQVVGVSRGGSGARAVVWVLP